MLAEDLPIHRYEMRTWPRRGGSWPNRLIEWWREETDFRAHIVERLDDAGPLRARDIDDVAASDWVSNGWGVESVRNVSRMLDAMWIRGEVGVSRREGAQRFWDLLDRCLPTARRMRRSPTPR